LRSATVTARASRARHAGVTQVSSIRNPSMTQAPPPMSNFRPQKPQSLHMYSQPHRLHCPPAPGHVPSEHALLPQYLRAIDKP
jgi:hypothetical protein